MENDNITEQKGEMHTFCIKFKTADYASKFDRAFREGASATSKSEVIFVQESSNIPVKSPDKAASPAEKSPAPAPAPFSFGDRPANVPTFAGFTGFNTGQTNTGFNFGNSGTNGTGSGNAFNFGNKENTFGFGK